MDDIDGRHTHTILSAVDTTDGNSSNNHDNNSSGGNSTSGTSSHSKDDKKRLCVSLPMYYDRVSVAPEILSFFILAEKIN